MQQYASELTRQPIDTDGTITLDSSDLELMHDGGGMQVVAIRFPSIDLAPGTTVRTASILFDVDEVRPGQSDQKVSITIFGEASANPAPLSAGSFDLSNRDTTSAAEMWTPTASTTTHEDLPTSDISSILNEIVRLPGWVSGNPMVILFGHVSGRGVRWVESARENNGIMTPALRWTTICGSGMGSTDAVIDTMDGPPEFLPLTNLYFSPACPLDAIDNAIYAISLACCTDLTPCSPTNQGVPAECTFDCNRVFAPFMTNCRDTIRALANDGDANRATDVNHSTMNKLDHYTQICSQFSVASMSAAIFEASCSVCGDDSVDAPEECDAGEANANSPDALCRLDCRLPRCGDGVRDSGEGCDEGDANSADGACGRDCQTTAGTVATGTGVLEMGTSRAGTTVQLTYTLSDRQRNLYAMAGTVDFDMSFPAAFQVAAPFGADVGGVSPAFFGVSADVRYDSWLTIGITDGSAGASISVSPGLSLNTWTATNGFSTNNGAVFMMSPSDGARDIVVLAQLTRATGGGSAAAVLQGRSVSGQDWDENVRWSL